MKDNSIAIDGAEVYLNDVYYFADEYISDNDIDTKDIRPVFNAILLYICDHIPKVDKKNIRALDNIFNIYIRLCAKYGINPTLSGFGLMTGIYSDFFTECIAGKVTPEHTETVKSWKNTCGGILVNNLSSAPGASVNQIFVAKAVYGLSDAPERNITEHRLILTADNLPKLSVTNGHDSIGGPVETDSDY